VFEGFPEAGDDNIESRKPAYPEEEKVKWR